MPSPLAVFFMFSCWFLILSYLINVGEPQGLTLLSFFTLKGELLHPLDFLTDFFEILFTFHIPHPLVAPNSMTFSLFTESYSHHHSQFWNIPTISKRNPHPLAINLYLSFFPPPTLSNN